MSQMGQSSGRGCGHRAEGPDLPHSVPRHSAGAGGRRQMVMGRRVMRSPARKAVKHCLGVLARRSVCQRVLLEALLVYGWGPSAALF